MAFTYGWRTNNNNRRKRTFRRRTVGKYRRSSRIFQRRVKRVIMKSAESKYAEFALENVALYHDRGAVGAGVLTSNQGSIIFNPWQNIARGTSPSSRIGDEIYPTGMGVRLLIRNEVNRPNVHYRIVVAVIPKYYNGTYMDGTNFDLGSQTSGNDILTNYFKKEGVKVLYDKIYHTYTQTAGVYGSTNMAYNRFVKLYVRSKRGQKIKWGEDASIINRPVGVWVIPYENYGTLRSDIVAHVSFSYKMYFKDP